MEKTELMEKLKLFLEKKSLKKSQVEKELGMPSNSLSNFLNGNKELPDKWMAPIEKYLEAEKVVFEGSISDTKKIIPLIQTAVDRASPKDKINIGSVIATKMVVDFEGFKEKPKMEHLLEVMGKIDKDFGKGAVMMMGDKPDSSIEVVSTGSLSLDNALGVFGLPKGRIVEIYGPESSGKTTLAIHVIAEAQRQGGLCAVIDAEHAFDRNYAKNLGVNIDNLILSQPDYGEQGLEIADRLIASGQVAVIVIDSVAALVPKGELEGEMGDSKMGLHARLMSQALRKMTGTISKTNTICIFINQLRDKIGVVFGNPETTTGGNALKFYASVRLDVRRSITNENSVINGGVKEGNQTTVKVIKNKVAPPFRVAVFDILYGKGINKIGEIVDLGVLHKIIEKSGSWFSYKGTQICQGRQAAIQLLTDNPAMANEIERLIREQLKK